MSTPIETALLIRNAIRFEAEKPANAVRSRVLPKDAQSVLSAGETLLTKSAKSVLQTLTKKHAKTVEKEEAFASCVHSSVSTGGVWVKALAKELRKQFGAYSTQSRVLSCARRFQDLRVVLQDVGDGEGTAYAIFRGPSTPVVAEPEDVPLPL